MRIEGRRRFVRDRNFRGGGEFETISNAIYVQDSWAISEKFTLNLGFRNESFDNRNAAGDSFIKIDSQLAPRVGFIWDPRGEGTSKLYANYGQSYLPIVSNTNMILRMDGFNLFDFDRVTEVEDEFAQESGATNPNDGLPTNDQAPRRVRFSATFRF